MSGKWNPKLHPRDGENGQFTRNWERRLSEQMEMASKRRAGHKPDASRPVSSAPRAKQLGYVRVGEHPDRMGAPGGAESYFGTSTHPDAGGVWVDPQRPGTHIAPRFLNDWGSAMSQLILPPSPTEGHKRDRAVKRREDRTYTDESRERTPARKGAVGPRSQAIPGVTAFRAAREPGGKIGRRLEGAPEAAVKEMRRAQARTRAETGRKVKRRTPGGTTVDAWMDRVNSRIEKGTRRG